MNSFNTSIKNATQLGRFAADVNKTMHEGSAVIKKSDAHHPGDDIGKLVLESYRNNRVGEMKAIIRAYQDGYNSRARELGTDYVEWSQIQKGMRLSLNGATTAEETGIAAAM